MADKATRESWNPLRWPPDRWISMSSAAIALCALFFTVYQSLVVREHQRLSSEPRMHVSYFYTKDWAGFIFSNIGLGPGKLHWLTVAVDKKLQPNWLSVFRTLGFEKPPTFEYVLPASEAWFGPAFSTEILKISPGPDYQKLSKEYSRIGVGGCYCSLYKECWLFEGSKERYAVTSCEEKPETVFSSPPFPK